VTATSAILDRPKAAAGLEQDQEKNGNAEEHARVNMDRTMADL
jgi:hypothetical protein